MAFYTNYRHTGSVALDKLDVSQTQGVNSETRGNVTATGSFVAASAKIKSGAMKIPANTVITSVTAIVKTALAQASATIGIRCGTTAATPTEIVTLDADSMLGTAAASLAVGKGNSSSADINAGLGGAAALTLVDGGAYASTERDVYCEAVASTGAFTAGEVIFVVEYINLD